MVALVGCGGTADPTGAAQATSVGDASPTTAHPSRFVDASPSEPLSDAHADANAHQERDASPSSAVPDATSAPDVAVALDASKFHVASVAGLALWLDAAQGIAIHTGNYVKAWADQSSNHNDCIAGETHIAEQPTLVASSINGLPALHFNPGYYYGDGGVAPNCDGENCGAGDNFVIADSPSLQWGTRDFLIEVVGRYTNSDPESPEYTYAGSFFFRSGTNGPWFRGNSYPTSPSTGLSALLSSKEGHDVNELVTTHTGCNDGKARLMAMQRVGTVVSIRVNGVATDSKTFSSVLDVTGNSTTVDGGDPCSDGVCVTIGASYSDVSRLDGDIAELVAVAGTIAPSDLAGIEGYLMAKYGLVP